MPLKTYKPGGTQQYTVEYATGDLRLNLTGDRSGLRDGEASIVVGRDVLNAGRLAKAPGRKPVATVTVGSTQYLGIPPEDQPLTTAIASHFSGNYITMFSGQSGEHQESPAHGKEQIYRYVWVRQDSETDYRFYLSPQGRDIYGELPEACVGGAFRKESDGWRRPKTIASYHAGMNPYIRFNAEEFGTDGYLQFYAGATYGFYNERPFTFAISYPQYFDKRGVWVSNGQVFWLLQDGIYTRYLDLGNDSGTRGIEWRGSQISPTVFMFVAPNYPPIVIPLNAPSAVDAVANTETGATKYMAGLLAPEGEDREESPTWGFSAQQDTAHIPDESLSSSMTGITANGTYRLLIRVIDDATGAASRFVPAHFSLIKYDVHWPVVRERDYITSPTGADRYWIIVESIANYYGKALEDGRLMAFRTARATHLEFWRTTSNGLLSAFYLELRWPVAFPSDVFFLPTDYFGPGEPSFYDNTYSLRMDASRMPWGRGTADTRFAALGMSDDELLEELTLGFPGSAIYRSGGLPPTCKDIISTQGMTLAGGTNEQDITLVTQGKTLTWPRVLYDEVVHHSEIRDSAVMPESFHPNDFRRLSRGGDVFQAFVRAGDTVLAVMKEGVHRIERVGGGELSITTLADRGAGTPWPRTAISIGRSAVWATPAGIQRFEPTAEEGLGSLELVHHGAMRKWFAEAHREGMDMEAGYDEQHYTLHFRRFYVETEGGMPAGRATTEDGQDDPGVIKTQSVASLKATSATISVPGSNLRAPTGPEMASMRYLAGAAIVNLATGAWTLMDDDSGFRYVTATKVDADDTTGVPKLYSMDDSGAVFEENYEGLTHPYDGCIIQDVLSLQEYDFTNATTEINIKKGEVFSIRMYGDVVRFYSTNPVINNQARRIIGVTWQTLHFDALDEPLSPGDSFTIGAVRFRIRYHPFVGAMQSNTKTLTGLEVDARPGARHKSNSEWPDPPGKNIEVRLYRDFGNTLRDRSTTEIGIYDDDYVAGTSLDRQCSVEEQGNAIEVELRNYDARADFVLSQVIGRFREDGDMVADTSVSA